MVVTVRSLGLNGIAGYEVSAECFLSGGLPAFDIVGLPDAAVREARERVRAAVKNCGAKFPVSRITVNLAPAGQKKAGTVYDLPIFVGILAAARELPPPPAEAEERSAARTAPAQAAASAAPASGGLWQALVEQYKNQLTPMYRIMLDDAWGDMEGDALVVRCGDELTQETLDCPAVAEVLRSVTGAHLGREVAVRFTLGKGETPPVGQAPDKLDALIRAGSKYDSFTVK